MESIPLANGVPVKTEHVNTIEMNRSLLASENKRLRQCIARVSERQEILEEMIQVEHGPKAVNIPVEYKLRVMMALSLYDQDLDTNDNGERNENYVAVMNLLRVANKYWKHQRSNSPKLGNISEQIRYERCRPNDLTKYRLKVEYD